MAERDQGGQSGQGMSDSDRKGQESDIGKSDTGRSGQGRSGSEMESENEDTSSR